MDDRIFQPLTLWRGSHEKGSGKGCAMNVISWENGDATITDFPSCSDPALARIVQGVNDGLAQGDGSLTPEDSLRVLELGHATVGTSSHGLSDLELKRVYVRLAVHAARSVLHLNDDPRVLVAVEAAEAWANDPGDEAAWAAAGAAAWAAGAAAGAAGGDRYFQADLASELITMFKDLTGTRSPEPDPEATARALESMLATV